MLLHHQQTPLPLDKSFSSILGQPGKSLGETPVTVWPLHHKPDEVIPQKARCQEKFPTAFPEKDDRLAHLALNPQILEGVVEKTDLGAMGAPTNQGQQGDASKNNFSRENERENVGHPGNIKCETNWEGGGSLKHNPQNKTSKITLGCCQISHKLMAKTNLRLAMTWQQLNHLISWPEEKLLGASEDRTGKGKRTESIIIANIHSTPYPCTSLCVLAHLLHRRLQ